MNNTLTQQAPAYSILCKTSELRNVMKFLKKASPKRNFGKPYICEITVKTNVAFFVTIGATMVLYCNATGPVKVTIPFLYLFDIVENIRTFNTQISIAEGELTIGNVTVIAKTFFFQDDTILRSINLPINFSVEDILRLPGQYTAEEIEFNEMNDLIKAANIEIQKDINKVLLILKKYGFTKVEIDKLVHEKISCKKLNPNDHEK